MISIESSRSYEQSRARQQLERAAGKVWFQNSQKTHRLLLVQSNGKGGKLDLSHVLAPAKLLHHCLDVFIAKGDAKLSISFLEVPSRNDATTLGVEDAERDPVFVDLLLGQALLLKLFEECHVGNNAGLAAETRENAIYYASECISWLLSSLRRVD